MKKQKIAVIGAGISGLSAAWLLSKRHNVVVFEADNRPGGHAHTVTIATKSGPISVDTGFIVYNTRNYPNFTALLAHLDVATVKTEMSFSVSHGNGRYEYSGSGFAGYFGQKRNLLSYRHWQLLNDIRRFFKTAENQAAQLSDDVTLGAFLEDQKYSEGFIENHILPMGAAIWSSDKSGMLKFPARSFISFYANHGMLQFRNRPPWRSILDGSRQYVSRLIADGAFELNLDRPIQSIRRLKTHVEVVDQQASSVFDHVVLATHADQALQLLETPIALESELLGCFRYQNNRAVLHRDKSAMPKRKSTWSSWNYLQPHKDSDQPPCVTYWMNRLQNLNTDENIFVTLNPVGNIAPGVIDAVFEYRHPTFDTRARNAQGRLWEMQGCNNTWYCGSYFGHGFHEDGIQAGLAVAEQLGGERRPWSMPNESGRITLGDPALHPSREAAA